MTLTFKRERERERTSFDVYPRDHKNEKIKKLKNLGIGKGSKKCHSRRAKQQQTKRGTQIPSITLKERFVLHLLQVKAPC